MKTIICYVTNFEFSPAESPFGIFEVDNGMNIACYCPCCDRMVTIDYSINIEDWEKDDKRILQRT